MSFSSPLQTQDVDGSCGRGRHRGSGGGGCDSDGIVVPAVGVDVIVGVVAGVLLFSGGKAHHPLLSLSDSG